LVQDDNEEEGVESEVPPNMGEILMIWRSMVIHEKNKGIREKMNILGFKQLFLERDSLLGERYAKLLLVVAVVRIWFPKKW
jgi:hypothetical protein